MLQFQTGDRVIRAGETNSNIVTIPLQYNFERSHYYEFTITITSTSVILTGIAVEEWNGVDGGDVNVKNLAPITVSFSEPGNWEEGDGGNATFN